jgi:hypothetical protein
MFPPRFLCTVLKDYYGYVDDVCCCQLLGTVFTAKVREQCHDVFDWLNVCKFSIIKSISNAKRTAVTQAFLAH